MKRSVTEVLRRGLDSLIANWPLIALRLVESMVLAALVVGAVIATIVPIAVAAGLGKFEFGHVENAVDAVMQIVIDHWVLILYALMIFAVLLIVLLAVHAFFEGGTALVLVDAERAGVKPRFNMARWLEGGRTAWWRIFWMYNIVWSVAGIVLLVPLAATIAGMIVARQDTGRIVIACGGLLLTGIVLLPTVIVATVWMQKGIAICVARNLPASEALSRARREISADFGRHFAVTFVVLAVSLGGAIAIGVLTAPMSILRHQQPMLFPMTIPVQIAVSFLQSIFSAATAAWFLACFIALTEEH